MRASFWVLLLVLAAGCSGGSGDRAARVTTATQESPPYDRRGESGTVVQAVKPAKPTGKNAKQKPQRRTRSLPWRLNGMSDVAHVKLKRVAVYSRPGAKRAMLVLRKRDERGTQRAFLVKAVRKKWVRVYLPTRPNGSQGWVRKRAVKLYTNGYRLVVRLRARKLNMWRGQKMLASYKVAIGTTSTPTPRGMFYVVELLKPRSPHGVYGPFAFGLSAHSNVHMSFAGGDGRVGLHGTNQPGLIGSAISNGCIRLRNVAIRKLAGKLPLGTPVYIRL